METIYSQFCKNAVLNSWYASLLLTSSYCIIATD